MSKPLDYEARDGGSYQSQASSTRLKRNESFESAEGHKRQRAEGEGVLGYNNPDITHSQIHNNRDVSHYVMPCSTINPDAASFERGHVGLGQDSHMYDYQSGGAHSSQDHMQNGVSDYFLEARSREEERISGFESAYGARTEHLGVLNFPEQECESVSLDRTKLKAESFFGLVESTRDAFLLFEAARNNKIPRITRRLTDSEKRSLRSGSVCIFDEKEAKIKRWTDGRLWTPSRIMGNFLIYRELSKKLLPNKEGREELASLDREGLIKKNQVYVSNKGTFIVKPDGLFKKTISLVVPDEPHLVDESKITQSSRGLVEEPDTSKCVGGMDGFTLNSMSSNFYSNDIRGIPVEKGNGKKKGRHYQHLIAYFRPEDLPKLSPPSFYPKFQNQGLDRKILEMQHLRRALKVVYDRASYKWDVLPDEETSVEDMWPEYESKDISKFPTVKGKVSHRIGSQSTIDAAVFPCNVGSSTKVHVSDPNYGQDPESQTDQFASYFAPEPLHHPDNAIRYPQVLVNEPKYAQGHSDSLGVDMINPRVNNHGDSYQVSSLDHGSFFMSQNSPRLVGYSPVIMDKASQQGRRSTKSPPLSMDKSSFPTGVSFGPWFKRSNRLQRDTPLYSKKSVAPNAPGSSDGWKRRKSLGGTEEPCLDSQVALKDQYSKHPNSSPIQIPQSHPTPNLLLLTPYPDNTAGFSGNSVLTSQGSYDAQEQHDCGVGQGSSFHLYPTLNHNQELLYDSLGQTAYPGLAQTQFQPCIQPFDEQASPAGPVCIPGAMFGMANSEILSSRPNIYDQYSIQEVTRNGNFMQTSLQSQSQDCRHNFGGQLYSKCFEENDASEETLQRISSKKGVKKVLILTREGQLIQSEPQNEENSKQAKQFSNLAKSIDSTLLEVDPQDGMTFMRLRTQKHEIMLAPAIYLPVFITRIKIMARQDIKEAEILKFIQEFSNRVYRKEIGPCEISALFTGRSGYWRRLDIVDRAMQGAQYMRVLEILYHLICSREYIRRRAIYYMDVDLFIKQENVDKICKAVARKLGVTQSFMHIMASPKGLIVGPLVIRSSSQDTVDCNIFTNQGFVLPDCIDLRFDFKIPPSHVVIVEKETFFQALLRENIQSLLHNVVIITAKGYPDINSTRFIEELWKRTSHLGTRFIGIFDFDPHGLLNLPTEMFSLLSQNDKKLAYRLLKELECNDIRAKRQRSRLQSMLHFGKKAELEILRETGLLLQESVSKCMYKDIKSTYEYNMAETHHGQPNVAKSADANPEIKAQKDRKHEGNSSDSETEMAIKKVTQ
ncbi:Global transcription regulator sge1 [Mycoemilia scoparia]|uniref:DNA topoisomerase (ATP-hydrolyzing) n=1 Tax=Mycoemilia scoparia TaxID=417184 RepID=A0A9W7ZXX9_9FUNG|nr:Global transcription regulator sge1 [Mycoemilia scoparia]